MADRRIAIAQDKLDFVNTLSAGDSEQSVFGSKAEVLTFAASVGYGEGIRSPLGTIGGDPIRMEIFENKRHDTFIHILAMSESGDPQILSDCDEGIDRRATIFEEYANGGLSYLMRNIDTARPLDSLLLYLKRQYKAAEAETAKDGGESVFDDISSLIER